MNMKHIPTFDEFLNEGVGNTSRIFDDPRISKKAIEFFANRYPRIPISSLRKIKWDMTDDIKELVRIASINGYAKDEPQMKADYEESVIGAEEYYGLEESENFDVYIKEAEEKDGNLVVQLTKSATGPFLKDLKANGCPFRKVTDTKFIVDNTGKVRLAIRLVKERSGMRAITVTPTEETI